ncbi:hypothetical protein METBIDRAFT_42108 [Metschnikowia bicuspidata var. bicuspidata NRRL YB-4993]|uniref:MICOS complex subunit n=1 Tax=Metschnikowia bicuspidata var. bicuspidata NRRL YB-4993 TaxID=869754 RepID=A0A1A0HA17_9ASCO|nr:hypothetical protein METBIDRAFT_42108 [Metschnikowia bicuspidata var. bicuspidata NRRL YB-4993]OBA20974.1 hypothetical protein METBIDRAFT_42108 [Metschnikowia bicuspidata var. bicuspidata NRRL YB-4993]
MARRSFYEDDEVVTTKPGVNTEIKPELKERESAHGNISFVDGMGVRTTPYLEKQANKFRHFVHEKTSVMIAELGTQKTAFCNEWQNLQTKLNETIVDPVFPGVLNFVFPILVTNVFVAKRALPLRFVASSLAAGLSLKYNMPLTYLASKGKLCAWEKDNLPELYEQQQELVSAANVWVKDARILRDQAKVDLEKLVHDARVAIAKALEDE